MSTPVFIPQEETKPSTYLTPSCTIAIENIFIKSTHNKLFTYLNDATDYLNQQNNKNLYYFAEDILYPNREKSSKRYFVSDYQTLFAISKTKKYSLYEYFDATDKLKLYIDIDLKNKDIPANANREALLDNLINECIDLMLDNLKEYHVEKPEIIILNSTRPDKISSHVIFNNIVFNNINGMISFIRSFEDHHLIKSNIFDPQTYKVGGFRMLWSSKLNVNVPLEFYKGINYEYVNDEQLFMDCLLKNISNSQKHYLININVPKNIKPLVHKNIKNINIKNNTHFIPAASHANNLYSANYLKRYIDILDIKRADAYSNWMQICFCIYNSNSTIDGFNLWHEWSQQSENYVSKDDCASQWNHIAIKSNTSKHKINLSIGTLKYLAKSDNPEQYSEIESSLDLPAYESIKCNRSYLFDSQDDKIIGNDNIVCKKMIEWYNIDNIKTLAIQSCINSGKTRFVHKIIDQFKFKRILMVSYRQSLTNDLYGSFEIHKFKSYLDGFYGADRIICQIESLHKLNCNLFDGFESNEIPEYDLVILDESESILNHFRSVTINEKENTFNLLRDIIYNSKKLLVLDGDFGNRSYEYISFFGESIILENECQKNKKNFIYTNNRNKFDDTIENDLKEGKNVVICSMSSKLATYYYDKFKDIYKCVLHCSKSDDILKKELKNVNSFWKQFQLIIYSPSIEAGIDFNIEHIDKIYVILSNKSTSQRGLLQMIGRIRQLKNPNILVYLNGLPYRKNISFYKFDEIKNYMIETNKCFNKTILDPISNKMIKVKELDLFNKILCYNLCEESNKATNIFVSYLNYLLDKKGYTYEIDDETRKKISGLNKENILKDEIIKAEDIDDGYLHTLIQKQSMNQSTREDKILIERRLFIKLWKFKGDREEIDQLIDKYYGLSNVLVNLRDLTNGHNIQGNELPNYDMSCRMNKVMMINQVINGLGYESVAATKLIKRDIFEENMKKVMTACELFNNPNKSHPLFGLSKKIPEIKTVKGFLGFVNTIFGDYGFQIRNVRKSIKRNKIIYHDNNYCIQFMNKINDFI